MYPEASRWLNKKDYMDDASYEETMKLFKKSG
jgi:hypothetical protein